MDNYFLEESFNTPSVKFDKLKNELKIEGRLIPEDPMIFFNKLIEFLDELTSDQKSNFTFNFHLFYYNTSSGKRLLQFMKRLDESNKESNTGFKVVWCCDEGDEDALEDGEEYKGFLDLSFEIVEIEED